MKEYYMASSLPPRPCVRIARENEFALGHPRQFVWSMDCPRDHSSLGSIPASSSVRHSAASRRRAALPTPRTDAPFSGALPPASGVPCMSYRPPRPAHVAPPPASISCANALSSLPLAKEELSMLSAPVRFNRGSLSLDEQGRELDSLLALYCPASFQTGPGSLLALLGAFPDEVKCCAIRRS